MGENEERAKRPGARVQPSMLRDQGRDLGKKSTCSSVAGPTFPAASGSQSRVVGLGVLVGVPLQERPRWDPSGLGYDHEAEKGLSSGWGLYFQVSPSSLSSFSSSFSSSSFFFLKAGNDHLPGS